MPDDLSHAMLRRLVLLVALATVAILLGVRPADGQVKPQPDRVYGYGLIRFNGHGAEWHASRARRYHATAARLQRLLTGRIVQVRRLQTDRARFQPVARTIDAYLARRGSPLAGHGRAFLAAGLAFDVDPRLVVAISAAETTFALSGGRDIHERHNAWGWGPHHYLAGDWPTAIRLFTRYLHDRYIARGLTTVQAIAPVYVGYASTWPRTVTAVLHDLGGRPDRLTFGGCS